MPRVARIVWPGVPHHVTQRGNNRQDVLFVDDDRQVYLDILRKQSAKYGLRVLGFCLMPNHVHLVAIPSAVESLAKAVGRTHFVYTQYLNGLHRRSGHLWQNRFFSCALDEAYLWMALAYVDRNPVRAGLVRKAWQYPWSSAAAHVGQGASASLLDVGAWQQMSKGINFQPMLLQADEEGVKRLRSNTHSGRPLGTDAFLSKLEHALGRRLRPLPVGRPKGVCRKGRTPKYK